NTEDLDALKRQFPSVHKELLAIFDRLERHYHDMCDTEFTIDQGKLWMLQTRVGKRTGAAALKMAVDMTAGTGKGKQSWKISKKEALMRVNAEHLDQVLHPQFINKTKAVAKGLAASPGAAVGKVYFTADDAEAAAKRGEAVILVRSETSPEDVHGMMVAKGILTSRGGLVSHAAVVARGWGTPAVVGADSVQIDGKLFRAGDVTVREGDVISLDGTTGEVMLGEMQLTAAEPTKEFQTILKWADEIRKGKLAVRANADTAEDATKAREYGAEGIGLCRTEHMFLAPDRLPVVRRMILASTPAEETAALEELRAVQKEDFVSLLRAMSGLPVTVRLLDPPLHEFLPNVDELEIKAATSGLDEQERKLLRAAHDWAEVNPMLGTRGVRLGVIKPGLYAMQVRALMQAADQVADEGYEPIVEVMIPLTVTR
ncbi:MAG: putative PEP-binding protein, partial [Acidimicrobiaceae bacterium]